MFFKWLVRRTEVVAWKPNHFFGVKAKNVAEMLPENCEEENDESGFTWCSAQHLRLFLRLRPQLLFHVDNGAGRFTAEYEPTGGGFCDGQWHSVTANKLRHKAELVVDGNKSQAESPNARSNTCDTNDPLYVGGFPSKTFFFLKQFWCHVFFSEVLHELVQQEVCVNENIG